MSHHETIGESAAPLFLLRVVCRRFAVIDPKPGRLVLFPGWLQHAVTPLPLERQAGARISISFNVGREGEDDGEEE